MPATVEQIRRWTAPDRRQRLARIIRSLRRKKKDKANRYGCSGVVVASMAGILILVMLSNVMGTFDESRGVRKRVRHNIDAADLAERMVSEYLQRHGRLPES